ncbi:hypothetical protein RND61_07515 [Streptomyces sp. TRM76323]|uniref:Uncharacterized protein n=1 Tax=Streptomyces tamarix TaxID=3078565 RepID=A0ABU3QHQ3_9ACTN|nr:hypothetical protein [Streptomyces tamarix]MDT9681922.1 hypothetical protein [Streptomyces tamarix]
MPAITYSASVVPVVSDVCGDCAGSLLTSDDGSMTGLPGELIPCGCTVPDGPQCSCQVIGWPLNDGFTGWIELSRTELRTAPEDAPVYRPCPKHNVAARIAARLAVAA